jgi:DNA topoisomerase-1
MAKYLVIVESPAKEKTISKILGKDFIIKSSYGHIRDLPKSKLGIDIEHNFKPTYIDIPKAKKTIYNLKEISNNVDKVYLATDFDREGEAIAWHLKEALKLPNSKISRITFHEITPEAILDSVKHPRTLDMWLVNSQQTRRLLDRLVGYKLSPLLWKKVKVGLSAGRVQSVAVMIICDREVEIQKFIPQEYWSIEAELLKDFSFKAHLFAKNDIKFEKLSIKNEKEANQILKELENAKYEVRSIETKQRKRLPYAPYTTSTMQQDASRRLGFSASKTMMIAQKLYEGINIGNSQVGLITYMRTDSLNIAKVAQEETLKFIESEYGNKFLPKSPRIYKTKSKVAQEAHEAIRPTSAKKIPNNIKQYLSTDEFKLYDLIWKRFLASQMAEAVYNTVIVTISANEYLFRAYGSTLIFEGFLKVYNIDDEEKETKLPLLQEKEILTLLKIIPAQHFTEPPARYNEASLIKALEEHGVGRPSTYAPTIRTILDRLYVRLDRKKFIPTNLGIIVNDVLKNHFGNIINIEYTAHVEEKLDKIAEDKAIWQDVLKDFYKPLEEDLKEAEKNIERQKIKPQVTDFKCPNCGKIMVIRDSRTGQFLGCSGYPECKITLPLNREGTPVQEQETDMTCDKCGSPLIKKIGFKGKEYLVCKKYPECKAIYNIDKNGQKIIKPEPEHTDIKCEKCGSEMLKRIGKRGHFLTCSAFPKCRNLQWIKTVKDEKPKIQKRASKKKVQK